MLDDHETDVWRDIDDTFGWWPGLRLPQPSVRYDIRTVYDDADRFADLEIDLNLKTLAALQESTSTDEHVYAMDWQHPCYLFRPHQPFEAAVAVSAIDPTPDTWQVPVLPNGDYYIFLATDFRFGIFGHPREHTISLFGDVLLNALAQHPPLLFAHPHDNRS
jgi:hypothetical protein